MKAYIRNLLVLLGLLALPGFGRAQFIFTTNNGVAITITGFNTSSLNLVIPAATNGYPVIGIGDFAFSSDHSVTNIVIPGSIVSIGRYAFYDCRHLTSASLPAGVTNLGQIVFAYCTNLTNITVDSANSTFSSAGGVLFNKAQTTLIEAPCGLAGFYKVPGSVTNIGFAAFTSAAISSVNIPESVIGLDTHAFNDCPNLTNIDVDPANPAYSSVGGVLFNRKQTELYQFPSGLSGDYVVPASVGYIGAEAFELSGVTSVVLPKTIGTIEYAAFASCLGLKSILIPGSVTNFGIYACQFCSNLTSAYFLGNPPSASIYLGDGMGAFDQTPATVYYLPGTIGWTATYGEAPTVLWNPQASGVAFAGGQFAFNYSIPSNAVIVIEACTNLTQPVWLPVATNAYSSDDQVIFQDPQSANYPMRFYRMRSP